MMIGRGKVEGPEPAAFGKFTSDENNDEMDRRAAEEPGSGRLELQRAHNNPMSTKTTIFFAIAAGFLGGIASQHISPPMVHAQAQPLIPKEIRAESFVIVDENGIPRGAFGIDKKGFPTVEATDAKGHVYWIRWGESLFGKGKPSVVPPQ